MNQITVLAAASGLAVGKTVMEENVAYKTVTPGLLACVVEYEPGRYLSGFATTAPESTGYLTVQDTAGWTGDFHFAYRRALLVTGRFIIDAGRALDAVLAEQEQESR